MQDIINAITEEAKTASEPKYDPERVRLVSVALRVLGAEHPSTERWVNHELSDSELHAEAMKIRKESERMYPDAKFQLGDAVRYEQRPCYYRGFIKEIDIFKGMFVYTVGFIAGETPIVSEDGKKPRVREECETLRINEAHLHKWHTTPIA